MMKLVLSKHSNTLSFKIDDGIEFVIYSNIERNESLNYRMAVTIFQMESFELTDFEMSFIV